MKSRFTTKFIYIFSILVILLLSLNNVFATPRSITNNFIRLIDFQNSGVDLYISNESLEQDLSRGDFNLKLFFDGRLLLRGKQYPQNIKIEIYTLTEGKKSFVSILNRTIKNNKAAENIFLITKLPRIIESTELYFDIYDANNILKATYTTNITVNTSEISKSESIDDYDCQEGDGECLIEYILRNLSFSASYDRNLKTEVVKNTKGRYTVSIPVKKGNTLKSKVREIGSSSGGGKTNGIGSNKLADPYPYFQNDVEVASTYWDEVRDSLKIKFANSNNEFNFKRDGSLQLSTNIDKGFLNIAAGTENKAPIVFTQGELLTDLVEGALEYDGSDLYFTKGGVRNILGAGSGITGPVGPAGAQGPAGPAGSSSGIDLSNGGFLNGSISFTGSSFIQDAVFNGSFQFKTAAQNGFVLTSDANGNATWTSFTTLPGAGDIASIGDCLTGACNNFTLTAASTGTIPLSIRGTAGQTANLTQWQNSSGVVSALITNNGEFSNSGKGSGTGNEFFGKNAGSSITLGSDNIAFGNNALNTATDSTTNIAIGTNALARTTRGSSNIAIGYQALYGSTTSISQRDNVAIGNHVLYNAIGVEDSVIIGDRAGYRITGADFNTFLGHEVNLGVAVGATGSSNIFIGHQAAYDETGDDTLIIDNRNRGSENNGRTMSLVYGKFNGDPANQTITFNANTGIGFTTPPHKLSVNGSVMIKDGTQATGYILTSDANGFASWQAPSAGDISSVGNCLSGSCNGFTLTADTTATTPLVLEARAGQTANLTQWQNNTGTVISRINNTGEFTATNQITLLDPDGDIVIRTPPTSGTGYGIGLNSVSAGFGSVAVLGTASGQRSTSVGGASAGGNDSVAVGVTASASSVNMVAIGREAGSISGGYNGGAGSILLGYQSQASANEFGISHNVNKESFWYNFGGFQGIQRIADFSFSAPVANSRTDYEGLLNFRVFENQNPLTAMSLRAFNGTTISTINGQLIYKNGTQANGYVLASDANGLATWQDPSSLLSSGASASGIAGAIQFSDGSNGFSSDANNLFWNSSTNRLRIGNHTPAINAPLQVQVDGAGTGFNIQFSPTEHTRFVSGGTFKGLMGSGSVPMVLFNSGEVRLMPGGIQTVTAAVSGGVGINNINPNSMLAIDVNSSSQQGLILKAASMQTANFTEWKDFNGNLLANISNEGSATFRGAYGALAFRTINSGATSFSVTNSGGNPRSTVTNGVWTIGEHPDAANLINAHGRFVQKSGGISRIATGTFAGPTVFQVMSNHGSSKSGSLSIEFASNIGGSVVSTSNGSVNAAIRNNLDGDIRFSVAKNIASNGSAANLEEVVSITNGGNMGIGFTNPMSLLDINGSLAMRDGTQAAGRILTSDANGRASWQNIFTVINGGTFSNRVILSTVALSGGNMRFGVIENGVDTFGWQDINNGRLVLKAKAPHAQTLTITPRGNGGGVPTLESSTGQIFLMPTAGGNQYNGFEFSNIGLNIRNQMTPQRILLANYWSSASGGINHEYSYIGWTNNTFHIETVNGGTGVTRNIMFSAPVTTINGSIAIRDGTQAAGRVLTSDANGSASWQANTSGLASGIAGAIQFSDGSNGFNSNAANLFWDNSNGRLGIGISNPSVSLQVSGQVVANQFRISDEIMLASIDMHTGVLKATNSHTRGGHLIFGNHNSGTLRSSWNLMGGTPTSDTAVANALITGANSFTTATINQDGGDIYIYGGNHASAGGNNGDVILAHNTINSSGNVGIGTSTPQRKLHISDAMRLEPRSSAPSSPAIGDLYVDSDSNELCFYDGSIWTGIKAGGACI